MIDHWNCGLTSVLLIWILESNNRQPQWAGECLPRVLHCLLRCVWGRGVLGPSHCGCFSCTHTHTSHTLTWLQSCRHVLAGHELPNGGSPFCFFLLSLPIQPSSLLSSSTHPYTFLSIYPSTLQQFTRSTLHCDSSPQLLLRHCLSQWSRQDWLCPGVPPPQRRWRRRSTAGPTQDSGRHTGDHSRTELTQICWKRRKITCAPCNILFIASRAFIDWRKLWQEGQVARWLPPAPTLHTITHVHHMHITCLSHEHHMLVTWTSTLVFWCIHLSHQSASEPPVQDYITGT